ncbi:ThuA domain-containing protein [Acidobacteria bacterium AH-259-G07]|nr:ThuA domain-containing protein [Acidobacteria bacterium AH-259-G07]
MHTPWIILALFLPLAAQAQNTSKVYSTAKRPRALALIGDRYHSPVYIRDNLIKALVRENIPVTFIENVKALSAESLSGHQLLVILRDGMIWPNGYDKPHVKWMTDQQQQAIWDFLHEGGGFLALHNAQGLYPPAGLYYKLFGGDYGGHPKPYVFTIRVENKEHPITAGVEDFEIFDEQHTVKYYLDREYLLLRSMARDNLAAPAGWWRELGKGRFCYLAPGHTPGALGHPMMQRLIRNAVRWMLRLE